MLDFVMNESVVWTDLMQSETEAGDLTVQISTRTETCSNTSLHSGLRSKFSFYLGSSGTERLNPVFSSRTTLVLIRPVSPQGTLELHAPSLLFF